MLFHDRVGQKLINKFFSFGPV